MQLQQKGSNILSSLQVPQSMEIPNTCPWTKIIQPNLLIFTDRPSSRSKRSSCGSVGSRTCVMRVCVISMPPGMIPRERSGVWKKNPTTYSPWCLKPSLDGVTRLKFTAPITIPPTAVAFEIIST